VKPSSHDKTSSCQVAVSFNPKLFEIYNDIRNLVWAKWQIPQSIKDVVMDKEALYPIALSLESSLKTYNNVASSHGLEALALVAVYKKQARDKIVEGTSKVEWGSEEDAVKQFAQSFADVVEVYQKKSDALQELLGLVESSCKVLEACEYSHASVSACIAQIQKVVTEMGKKGLVNMDQYVSTVNKRLHDILAARVTERLTAWLDKGGGGGGGAVFVVPRSSTHFELKLRNSDQICLEPPLPTARTACMSMLNDMVQAMVDHPCLTRDLERDMVDMAALQGSSSSSSSASKRMGSDVVNLVDPVVLGQAIRTIQGVMDDAQQHVEEWMSRQGDPHPHTPSHPRTLRTLTPSHPHTLAPSRPQRSGISTPSLPKSVSATIWTCGCSFSRKCNRSGRSSTTATHPLRSVPSRSATAKCTTRS
jgi:hypothetical protein